MAKLVIDQWLPPQVIDKIRKEKNSSWFHLHTVINTTDEYDKTITITNLEGNRPEFFVNGEEIKENKSCKN